MKSCKLFISLKNGLTCDVKPKIPEDFYKTRIGIALELPFFLMSSTGSITLFNRKA